MFEGIYKIMAIKTELSVVTCRLSAMKKTEPVVL